MVKYSGGMIPFMKLKITKGTPKKCSSKWNSSIVRLPGQVYAEDKPLAVQLPPFSDPLF